MSMPPAELSTRVITRVGVTVASEETALSATVRKLSNNDTTFRYSSIDKVRKHGLVGCFTKFGSMSKYLMHKKDNIFSILLNDRPQQKSLLLSNYVLAGTFQTQTALY